MKKKTIIIILVCLVVIAILSLCLGLYFSKISKPETIVGYVITNTDNRVTEFLSDKNKYYLGDNFSINTKIDFNLNSEDYQNKSKTDKEYLKKVKLLNNLSQLETDINLKQNLKKKQEFFSILETINKEQLVNYKYLIDNSTEYYYINNITKNYVNNGTSNLFEAIDKDNNTLSNIDYLHTFIIDSLKNNIRNDYVETFNVTENINNSSKKVKQISLKLTDKEVHEILNGVLFDLKNDSQAKKILTSLDENFENKKIKDKTVFLGKNESYTFNIYVSKYLSKLLKIELIHMDGDNKEIITYEGDNEVGTIYYIINDRVIYKIDALFSDKTISFEISNSKQKNIGKVKIDRDDKGYYMTLDYNDSSKNYEVVYSSKYLNVNKRSFTNEKLLSLKLLNNKVSVLNGTIKATSIVTSDVSIEENTSNAILSSSLTEEQKKKISLVSERVKERLEK